MAVVEGKIELRAYFKRFELSYPPFSPRLTIRGISDLKEICTSHVERHNLTIRTFIKRFTRLALGFSKSFRNLQAAVALHVTYHNFCWRPRLPGKTGRRRPTPAMSAGLVSELWDFERLFDAVTQHQEEQRQHERMQRLIDRFQRRNFFT